MRSGCAILPPVHPSNFAPSGIPRIPVTITKSPFKADQLPIHARNPLCLSLNLWVHTVDLNYIRLAILLPGTHPDNVVGEAV